MDIIDYCKKMDWNYKDYARFANVYEKTAWKHLTLQVKPHKKFVLKLNLLTKGKITQADVDRRYKEKEENEEKSKKD